MKQLEASDFVECNSVMGYHFDTFGYIEINHEEGNQSIRFKTKELLLLDIGKSIEI